MRRRKILNELSCVKQIDIHHVGQIHGRINDRKGPVQDASDGIVLKHDIVPVIVAMNHGTIQSIQWQLITQPADQINSPGHGLFNVIKNKLKLSRKQKVFICDAGSPECCNKGTHIQRGHPGHQLAKNRCMDLWWLRTEVLAWHKIHHREHTPQDRLIFTKAMNHRGIEALLIERLMHQLEIHQLLRLTRWTQHTKNPWLLVNQFVALQPGISTTGQPRWFLLVGDTF